MWLAISMVDWHSIDEAEVLKELRTDKDRGLSAEESAARLE
jgi:hypothetical protein